MELHNLQVFPSHNIVLQFTHFGGKRVVISVSHQQCQAFTNQNSIQQNIRMNFPQTTSNQATTIEIDVLYVRHL